MTDNGAEDQRNLNDPAVEGAVEAPAGPEVTNPWADAFAKLEDPAPGTDEAGTAEDDGEPAGAPGDTGPTPDVHASGIDAPVGAGDAGGPAHDASDVGGADEPIDAGVIEGRLSEYIKSFEDRAVDDTWRMFTERTDEKGNKLIRQTNGKLGATINDADIYRVDESTGAATFYNPDTGRPFTGDNPRAQAKAWVDAYNEELRDAFNEVAANRQQEIESEMAPVINLLKFTPKYERLDPVRRQMFDALIDGYEVFDDDNNHVGYSVDLDQALERVNRQVEAIRASQATPPSPPTGPAVDMPTSGSGSTGVNEPIDSLEKAMEAHQNALLEKSRKR
ncbi:hypothetical protein [uncultured Halomonas sp.]|uniref:hypothetical protein n=1 Tax=uncultured Halomonas sp. TaxID=173971 RepID=UPI00261E1A0C|nr:hypothetical protein [uncultured Halomonas sp.]